MLFSPKFFLEQGKGKGTNVFREQGKGYDTYGKGGATSSGYNKGFGKRAYSHVYKEEVTDVE